MAIGPASSESTTKQEQIDSRVAATDQAVVFQPRLGGKGARYIAGNNQPVNIKVGAKGQYTVTNTYGASKEDLADLFKTTSGSITDALTGIEQRAQQRSESIDDALNRAVADRIPKQIEAGGETAAENAGPGLGKSNYILLAVGVFLLLAAIAFKRRHR